MTKPDAPTGIDDKRCAIDMAIIRGCLSRMRVTLRWGPTGLMLGDALTKYKAEAADLLRACVRASAYQLADESSTLQWAREEGEARSFARPDGKIRCMSLVLNIVQVLSTDGAKPTQSETEQNPAILT